MYMFIILCIWKVYTRKQTVIQNYDTLLDLVKHGEIEWQNLDISKYYVIKKQSDDGKLL